MPAELSLILREDIELDEGDVRVDQADLHLLGITSGEIVALTNGLRTSYARILPAFMEDRNQRLIRVSPRLCCNIGGADGQAVKVLALHQKPNLAEAITFAVKNDIDYLHLKVRLAQLATVWRTRIFSTDDVLNIPTLDQCPLEVQVVATEPFGPVQMTYTTRFEIAEAPKGAATVALAGMRALYYACHRLTGNCLRGDLASSAANAVLLTGPASCGKAQLVKRLADDLQAHLYVIDTHHLLDRWETEGKLELEGLFADFARLAPVIVMVDNMEGLREHPAHHPVATRLCAFFDEMKLHKNIVLFGICSGIPDPRFLVDRRFDLVFQIDAPDRLARQEILTQAVRARPLDTTVDLQKLSVMTLGYTAADLLRLVATAEFARAAPELRQADFMGALRKVAPSAFSPIYCDMPTTSWDDVAGLDEVKSLLRETIFWLLHYQQQFTEADVNPPHSILISGSNGTGKTTLVRALPNTMPLRFIEIACSMLITQDRDSAVKFLKDSFALARRKTPCLIFFDEIDVLFNDPQRTEDTPAQNFLISQLLFEMERLSQMTGVIVVAATSRPDRLSNDMMRPGRFDYAIALPMPDAEARKKILQIHAHKLPLASDVDFDRLAELTQGMTPADITNICNRVGLLALRQSFNNDGGVIPPVVSAALFEQVLRGRKG